MWHCTGESLWTVHRTLNSVAGSVPRSLESGLFASERRLGLAWRREVLKTSVRVLRSVGGIGREEGLMKSESAASDFIEAWDWVSGRAGNQPGPASPGQNRRPITNSATRYRRSRQLYFSQYFPFHRIRSPVRILSAMISSPSSHCLKMYSSGSPSFSLSSCRS